MTTRRRVAAWAALLAVAAASCGDNEEGALSHPGPDGGVTVTRALAGDTTSGWIRGYIVARSGEPVLLCEAPAGSSPPACTGPSIVLRDGVIWRQPGDETVVIGRVTDGLLVGSDAPCGYAPGGPCSAYPGVSSGGGVLWTEVEYSVLGVLRGGELHGPTSEPGAD